MQCSDEVEENEYFDSKEFISNEDERASDFAILLHELRSVDERRRDFYRKGGIALKDSFDKIDIYPDSVPASSESCDCIARESEVDEAQQPIKFPSPDVREEVFNLGKKKAKINWWRYLANRMRNKRANTKPTKANLNSQEVAAQNGVIWTLKFSRDGKYLATAGEDRVVRIWKVSDPVSNSPRSLIADTPLAELRGHEGDVLDVSWSSSNLLLSSSTDETVRLWETASGRCLGVFRHTNYVTCVQFHPINGDIFVSGSIDGMIRVWGISEKRVMDWAPTKDIITSLCYNPDGNCMLVGCLNGWCRFYECRGRSLEMEGEMRIEGRKRGKKITGIQFLHGGSRRVIIACDDSYLRVFDGIELIRKFRGHPKSGSQRSTSFTSTERHAVSVGLDSRIYVWNYDDVLCPKRRRESRRACQQFYSEGVSAAASWCPGDVPRSKVGFGWMSADVLGKCSAATWPEEKLEEWGGRDGFPYREMVIITAALDGTVKVCPSYGLPIRL